MNEGCGLKRNESLEAALQILQELKGIIPKKSSREFDITRNGNMKVGHVEYNERANCIFTSGFFIRTKIVRRLNDLRKEGRLKCLATGLDTSLSFLSTSRRCSRNRSLYRLTLRTANTHSKFFVTSVSSTKTNLFSPWI